MSRIDPIIAERLNFTRRFVLMHSTHYIVCCIICVLIYSTVSHELRNIAICLFCLNRQLKMSKNK